MTPFVPNDGSRGAYARQVGPKGVQTSGCQDVRQATREPAIGCLDTHGGLTPANALSGSNPRIRTPPRSRYVRLVIAPWLMWGPGFAACASFTRRVDRLLSWIGACVAEVDGGPTRTVMVWVSV